MQLVSNLAAIANQFYQIKMPQLSLKINLHRDKIAFTSKYPL